MPLQSGSDRVLKAMRRSYRQRALPRDPRPGPRGDARRGDHHRHHRRLPRRDRGGLPGHARRRARRRGSPAPSPSSTPSAPAPRPPTCRTRCRKAVVQERYERLVALVRTRSPGRRTSGSSAAPSRCWSPRARAARTAPRTGCPAARATTGSCTSPGRRPPSDPPGRHGHRRGHLRRPAPPRRRRRRCSDVRRTRAGDAWEARTAAPAPAAVGLGMPALGAPAPLPEAPACG